MSDSAQAVPHPLYASSIQEVTRSNDRTRMQEMEKKASQHLEEVKSALEELRSSMQRSNS
jgi:hypothetical protein